MKARGIQSLAPLPFTAFWDGLALLYNMPRKSPTWQRKEWVEEIQVSKTEDSSIEDCEKRSETSLVSKQGVHLSVQINDRYQLAQTMLVGWYFKKKIISAFFLLWVRNTALH